MEKKLEKNSKDKFILDNSAFLSLEGVHLLDTVLKIYSIITTPLSYKN